MTAVGSEYKEIQDYMIITDIFIAQIFVLLSRERA